MIMTPDLYGEGILLRPFTIEDHDDILTLRSDKVSNRYLHRKAPKDINEIKSYCDFIIEGDKAGKWHNWGIEHIEEGKLIGLICLWNFNIEQKYADIGYELNSKYTRKGIMSQSISLVLGFASRQPNISVIGAYTRKDNPPSNNLLLKKGFLMAKSSKANIDENYYERKVDIAYYKPDYKSKL